MIKLLVVLLFTFNAFSASEFKLEIKKRNGEIYWKEYFRNRKALDTWLKEEKTRKYWDASYSENIEEVFKEEVLVSPEKIKSKKLLKYKLNTKEGLTLEELNEYLRD